MYSHDYNKTLSGQLPASDLLSLISHLTQPVWLGPWI